MEKQPSSWVQSKIQAEKTVSKRRQVRRIGEVLVFCDIFCCLLSSSFRWSVSWSAQPSIQLRAMCVTMCWETVRYAEFLIHYRAYFFNVTVRHYISIQLVLVPWPHDSKSPSFLALRGYKWVPNLTLTSPNGKVGFQFPGVVLLQYFDLIAVCRLHTRRLCVPKKESIGNVKLGKLVWGRC